MAYQLVVLKGRSDAKTIRLAQGATTIGRQDGCELTVRSSQVSRKHCQLFEKKGLLLVKDLGSSNGTIVNNQKVDDQRVLEPGDVLTVGPISFRVEQVGAPAPATVTPTDVGGSAATAKPTDTAVAEAVEAIPLDDDDVLDFVTGAADEPEPAPPKAAAKPATPKAEPKPKPAEAKVTPKAEPKPAGAKPKPRAEPEPEPDEPAVADEAVAEFLMGIEFDDEDRR